MRFRSAAISSRVPSPSISADGKRRPIGFSMSVRSTRIATQGMKYLPVTWRSTSKIRRAVKPGSVMAVSTPGWLTIQVVKSNTPTGRSLKATMSAILASIGSTGIVNQCTSQNPIMTTLVSTFSCHLSYMTEAPMTSRVHTTSHLSRSGMEQMDTITLARTTFTIRLSIHLLSTESLR